MKRDASKCPLARYLTFNWLHPLQLWVIPIRDRSRIARFPKGKLPRLSFGGRLFRESQRNFGRTADFARKTLIRRTFDIKLCRESLACLKPFPLSSRMRLASTTSRNLRFGSLTKSLKVKRCWCRWSSLRQRASTFSFS